MCNNLGTRPIRLAALLAGLIPALTTLTAGAALAGTMNFQSGQHDAEIACGGAVQNASLMMKLAPSDPDGKYPQATKDYNDYLKRCPSPRYSNAARSWATYAQAIVDHRSGTAWSSDLDDAIAHLTTCVSDFSGKMADDCQTSLAHAKQNKIDWAAGTAAAPVVAPSGSAGAPSH